VIANPQIPGVLLVGSGHECRPKKFLVALLLSWLPEGVKRGVVNLNDEPRIPG
jgi:hypothetical protein